MKRIATLMILAALCLSALTACADKAGSTDASSSSVSSQTAESSESSSAAQSGAGEESGATQIPNPILERESLDAVNEATGAAMKRPDGLTVEEESYSTIESGEVVLGQYSFTYNGVQYTLRAAKTQEDISGVWQDSQTLGDAADGEATAMETEDGGLWSRWFDGDVQYSLYAQGAAADDFTAVYDALR